MSSPADFSQPILAISTNCKKDASEIERQSSTPITASLDANGSTGEPPSLRTPPLAGSSVGGLLLRDDARNIDPLETNHGLHDNDSLQKPSTNVKESNTSLNVPDTSREEVVTSLPTSPLLSLRSPAFTRHSKNTLSLEGIPRQTIMKALASRPLSNGTAQMTFAELLSAKDSSGMTNDGRDKVIDQSSNSLSAVLSNLQLCSYSDRSPSTTRLALQSPCFFHQRFDDAVNIKNVLEEIADDEWLSHSRLVQTATGVREVSKQLQRRPIKRAVRNVMIVTKARDNNLVCLTRELAEWLISTPRYGSDVGVNVYIDSKLRNSKRFDVPGLLAKHPRYQSMLMYWTPDLCWTSPEKFDLVLTLGGDGTVLFTSWLFQRIVPPILSFSLGSLGFLTNFEFEKYKEHLNNVMGDVGMRVNLRMRFTCTVYRADRSKGAQPGDVEEGEQFEVLNELVIDRGPSPYVSNLELYGDNELLTVVQADGCIFSTPTGSTAYSLSAGGSLIHPSIPGILLTPICPHTLSFRPMVLSDTMLLRISVPISSRSTAYCSFDGKGRVELRQGDYVTVEASQYPFPTVVSGGGEWFESVRRALRWNVRGVVQKGWSGGSRQNGTTEDEDGFRPEEEETDFDIDFDNVATGTDSGFGPSEDGDAYGTSGTLTGTGSGSPMKRQMSLLNL